MGCDIHIQVEVRRNGRWANATDDVRVYDGRNYWLFGLLAEVRGGGGKDGPIAPPRGLPPDMDSTTPRPGEYDHTPSWFTLRELLDHDWSQLDYGYEEYEETHAAIAGMFYSDFMPDLALLGLPDDVRIVFWFDS